MSTNNRATLLNKTAKAIKKHYKPVAASANRSVLETLLYACCLEKSAHEAADDVFAKLQESYFDWNEVRVTTIAELAEMMAALHDPADAAQRLKRTLQAVFESHYAFDIEFLKKQNLGKAVKDVEAYAGVTPFAVAYVTQNALGGHAIPVNEGVFQLFLILGIVSESEAASRHVPGLERTIPKSKGAEFSSLLHQFAVEFLTSPHSPRVRSVILEIDPDAKDRLPKRTTKKSKAEEDAAAAAEPPAKPKKTAKSTPRKTAKPKKAAKKSASKRLAQKKPR